VITITNLPSAGSANNNFGETLAQITGSVCQDCSPGTPAAQKPACAEVDLVHAAARSDLRRSAGEFEGDGRAQRFRSAGELAFRGDAAGCGETASVAGRCVGDAKRP